MERAPKKPPIRVRLSAAEAETLLGLQRQREAHVASIAESRGLARQGLYRLDEDVDPKTGQLRALYLVQVEEGPPPLTLPRNGEKAQAPAKAGKE